ncbi:C40 family peptidase [Diplocloster agilis]|uniref:C40 family peptidase n=1 Tax=Diplocloster agilis TaxID=2850323 RepID=UPI000822DEE1|nr:SH3 domain-containing protein [Suonthocola fibrivorans]MCU6733675.1 SH3 domain-containing protein [Suonthocola fibrivorans]SCJ03493.1 Probable endopeptidase p60 precursor [uncultured Clostridium sp.]
MKKQIVLAVLCLSLTGAMIFGGDAVAMAATANSFAGAGISAEIETKTANVSASVNTTAQNTQLAAQTDAPAMAGIMADAKAVATANATPAAAPAANTDQPAADQAAAPETQAPAEEQAAPAVQVEGYTNLGIAQVDNHLNVREEPDEGAKLVGKMPKNAGCEVLEVQGDWTKIESGKVTGYVKSEYLLTGDAATEAAQQAMSKMAKVNTTTLYVRAEPNTESTIVTLVPIEEELEVLEELDGWVKVNIDGDEGYVSAEYVDVSAKLPKASTIQELQVGEGVSEKSVSVVSYAKQFVGNRYVYGGTSLTNGTDCSGFTMGVYAKFGIGLPHSSRAQANCGTRVGLNEVQPGDLVFYSNGGGINHVALYIGGGQVVHASSPKSGIKISGMYYRTPVCATRVMK